MHPLWGALAGHVGSFALSLLRSLSLCLLSVHLPTPIHTPLLFIAYNFQGNCKKGS